MSAIRVDGCETSPPECPAPTRRSFLRAGAGLAASSVIGSSRVNRPNFVFILMDDLGWRDVGFNGSDFYETPNIDLLASQSVRFSQAYAACPVCSPTRASILTGKYPARLHLTNFLPGVSPRKYGKLSPPEFEQQLSLRESTIPKALREAGYVSGMIGKWHLGGKGYSPDKYGFDFVFATGGGHLYPGWNVNPPYKPREGEQRWERLTNEAERFIQENRGRPFFLYLAHHLVHVPLQSTRRRIAKYQAKANMPRFRARHVDTPEQNNPVYAAMVEEMDESVGRVMKTLEIAGVAERTIIIFSSDNGGLTTPEQYRHQVVTSNAPLRGGKGCVYEGGIRVPLLIRWPNAVHSGSLCDVPASSVDHYPTIMEIAGVKDERAHKFDGESLVPLLARSGKLRRNSLYWHYPHYNIEGGWPAGAVRTENLKLIESYEEKQIELYDLSADPGERKDLSRSMPRKVNEMVGQLKAWRTEVNAAMPTRNPNYDAAREFELDYSPGILPPEW